MGMFEPGESSAYVGLGSNLGDRTESCRRAVRMLDETSGCRVRSVSSLYLTEPVGVAGHDWYLNAVTEVRTALRPLVLLRTLLALEAEIGRVRAAKLEPRVIDLDLLLYGRVVAEGPELILPHPRMHARRFVMVPLAEIAPGLVHPVLGLTVREMLDSCPSEGQVISLWPSGNPGWHGVAGACECSYD